MLGSLEVGAGEDRGSLVAGAVLAERYVLVRPLGSGGMATVWCAEDSVRRVDVALKILHPARMAPGELEERFAHEADLSERMLSRNIVRVLDRDIGPPPILVLELIDGEVLSTKLARGVLLRDDAATVVVQICRALSRAHAASVVHRDIKPDNVMLCREDGRMLVKVLDFGVAALGLSGAHGARAFDDGLTGTIGYIAPEHALGGLPPGPRADLFAVGVIAFQCLTGKMPYSDASLADYVMGLSQGLPANGSLFDGSTPALDAWLRKALAFDPEARFTSASVMAEAFFSAAQPKVRSRSSVFGAPRSDAAVAEPASPTQAPAAAEVSPPPRAKAPSAPPAKASSRSRPRAAASSAPPASARGKPPSRRAPRPERATPVVPPDLTAMDRPTPDGPLDAAAPAPVVPPAPADPPRRPALSTTTSYTMVAPRDPAAAERRRRQRES